jgi:hypothetical protein
MTRCRPAAPAAYRSGVIEEFAGWRGWRASKLG